MGAIEDISWHCSGDLFVSVGDDRSICLCDIRRNNNKKPILMKKDAHKKGIKHWLTNRLIIIIYKLY